VSRAWYDGPMVSPQDVTVTGIVQRLAGRLRHPVLFFILLGLFLFDLVIPDLLPFIDEVMLGLLTVLTGSWTGRRQPTAHPPQPPPVSRQEKDVTPPEERERIRDFERR
jgi:hypothetical protein